MLSLEGFLSRREAVVVIDALRQGYNAVWNAQRFHGGSSDHRSPGGGRADSGVGGEADLFDQLLPFRGVCSEQVAQR